MHRHLNKLSPPETWFFACKDLGKLSLSRKEYSSYQSINVRIEEPWFTLRSRRTRGMFSLNSWTDRKNRLCSFCQHLQNFFLSTRQNLSWKSWIFVKLRQNMCRVRCVCSDPSSHHVCWWLSLCDVGGSALFFVSSFPVKNVKGLLINKFIFTPMAEAAKGFSTFFQILPATKVWSRPGPVSGGSWSLVVRDN